MGDLPMATDLFILYQMGSSEDYTWYSVVAIFLSEKDLRRYAALKAIGDDLTPREPDEGGDVSLPEPVEFVVVRAQEGEVPDVELAEN
jgi:hypothetical protein